MKNHISKCWVLPKKLTPDVDEKLSQFPRPVRQILFNRGFEDFESCERFLSADYPLADPYLLSGMLPAAEKILYCIKRNLPMVVFGDYDVDGVSGTALLVQALQKMGALVIPYIPDRFEEGYGLNNQALDSLKNAGINLVITVDCGIRSIKEAAHANEIGLELIISDHHHPRGGIPSAHAVICPKQDGDIYPNKNISGVGLAYKIAQALFTQNPILEIETEDWLDLVALGTVADMVSLIDENRFMVRQGIEKMRDSKRIGLLELSRISGIDLSKVTSGNIGFMLGPRLNAAGRLESAKKAFQLLMAEDSNTAGELARELDQQNQERQLITRTTQQIAQEIVVQNGSELILFAADEEFNEGIIGLAASRLTEEYYRPAIVGTRRSDGTVRASCRSIPEFHITNALDECADLLVQHGGHALAAGFTIDQKNLDLFLEKMGEIAAHELKDQDLSPKLKADAEVPLVELKPDLLNYFDQFEPTGIGNPAPLLVSKNVKVSRARAVGKDNSHMQLTLTDGLFSFDAIAFQFGHLVEKLPNQIDIMFAFERDNYYGEDRLKLRVIDIKFEN